ncbi:phosphotransferase [Ewingella sp. S1.OA.A_B6]
MEQLIAQKFPAAFSAGFCLSQVAGLSGESWKIETRERNWLARIQSPARTALGVERQREKEILQRVAHLNIAPRVKLYSPPWLVVEWLEGHSCEGHPVEIVPLAELLARLHQVPPHGYLLQLKQQFSLHWQQIDRRRLSPRWLRLQHRFMRQSLPVPLKMAVIHMDVHPGNLITSEQGLQLIDWEYAAGGDIALELATLFRGNNWLAEQQQRFLAGYCAAGGYRDVSVLQRQIHRWLPWVDYMMLMWFEVRWHQTGDKTYSDWAQPLRERLFATVRTSNKIK